MVQVVLVLLAFLLSVSGDDDWAKCPTTCKCVWSQGKKAAECPSAGLTAIPRLSSQMQMLSLNGNNFHILPSQAFINVGLVNLHRLFIKSSSIVIVDRDALAGMNVLIELDLSENQIEHLHHDLLRGCEKIREVNFKKNPIKSLERGIFSKLNYLQNVDVSDCQISSVSIGAFSDVPTLKTVRLDGNKLKFLDLAAVPQGPKLGEVTLTNNPWECDCQLRPLRNWVLSKSTNQNVLCSNNKKWKDLSEWEFACIPEIVSSFKEGSFLGCLVSGDPLPTVNWYFNSKPISNHSYNGAEYLLSSNGGWFNLTIRHAKGRDSGEYKCIAKNAAGVIEKSLIVKFDYDDDLDGGFGGAVGAFDVWPLIVGVVVGALLLLVVVLIMCCCLYKKQRHGATKKDVNGMIPDAEEKSLMTSVNPVQKPPRRQETALNTSETELLESGSLPYNENGSIIGTSLVDNQSTPAGTMSRSRGHDSIDPPDLLAFPGKASSVRGLGPLGSPGSRPSHLAQFGTLPYARSHSPFSPPAPVVPRTGYVTIPRRPRVPSWTASLSPVLVSPEESYFEPVYDNLGPRTTVNGSSVLSLNKMDLTHPVYKNRPLPLTPYEPITEQGRQSWARSTPDAGDEREMLIGASPHAIVASAKKVPPNPPPKPKKKKSLYEDEGVDGTEV